MMEKYKNKKGFTLIELIVVIAIIAALSVTMGISAVQTMKDTRIKEYREKYADIFDAARLYSGLKVPPIDCEDSSDVYESCEAVTSYPTSIPLCCLIEAGLLDYNLTSQYDPLTKDLDFNPMKQIVIDIDGSNSKVISTVNDSCSNTSPDYTITSKNLDGYEKWEGEC